MLVLIILSAMSPALGATYKWVDEKGITHYGDTIPPQYVNRGLTEINKTGLPIRKTDPALTPDQLRAHEDELAKQKRIGKQAEERRRRDLALMGTYTSEVEIDLARDRNTRQIDIALRSAEERLAKRQTGLVPLRKQMDGYRGKDPSGKTREPPPELMQEIEQARQEQTVLAAAIAELQGQKAQVIARFGEDKTRFREIKLAGVGSPHAASPADKTERASVPFTINATTAAVVNECLARWSDGLGGKSQAVSAELIQQNSKTDLVLNGRVTNKAGQSSAKRFVCPLTAEGKIDQQGTDIKKALASLGDQHY
ncbi:MAG: DUF4124 domain-containing protein [Burkholderiales bacterium]|nr:DUF4124 domain-containing protein [Burkholderiales bacterium]